MLGVLPQHCQHFNLNPKKEGAQNEDPWLLALSHKNVLGVRVAVPSPQDKEGEVREIFLVS